MMQSAPDIRRNLKNLEEFERKRGFELMEVAQRVFNTREREKKKERENRYRSRGKRFERITVLAFKEEEERSPALPK